LAPPAGGGVQAARCGEGAGQHGIIPPLREAWAARARRPGGAAAAAFTL